MSTANFKFYSQNNKLVTTIVVELLDTPASRAWQFAVMLNNPKKNVFARTTAYYCPELNWNLINNHLDQLKSSLEKLKGTQFEYSGPLPDNFDDFDQKLLNQLHRHFTQSCRDIWDPTFMNFELQTSLNPLYSKLTLRFIY